MFWGTGDLDEDGKDNEHACHGVVRVPRSGMPSTSGKLVAAVPQFGRQAAQASSRKRLHDASSVRGARPGFPRVDDTVARMHGGVSSSATTSSQVPYFPRTCQDAFADQLAAYLSAHFGTPISPTQACKYVAVWYDRYFVETSKLYFSMENLLWSVPHRHSMSLEDKNDLFAYLTDSTEVKRVIFATESLLEALH
jgi:hypothetical protein